jgi:tetratricopeptide (TPR) repeat protein
MKIPDFNRTSLRKGIVCIALLLLAGCSGPEKQGPTAQQIAAANQQAVSENYPAGLRSDYVDLLTQGERQYVLNAMKLGMDAIHQGYPDIAKRTFDQAIKRVQALQEGAAQAERAKSKFVPEEEKWFKGEAYERAALYLYRGLLYAADGDWGNAAACAKRTQLEDISSKEEDSGDYYSAEWLLALASLKQNDPGTAKDALARAAKFPSKQGDVPPPHEGDNVLVVAEAGHGPVKVAIGEYREKLTYVPGECKTVKVSVTNCPTPMENLPAAESLYVQATTRGARKVDYILNGKAEFKAATDMAGNAAIIAGAATAATSNNNTQTFVGLGLVAAGLISKGVSAGTHPEADTRMWDNLPSNLFFYSLKCPAGTNNITIRAFSSTGNIVKEQTVPVVINNQQAFTVIWIKLP